MKSKFTYNAFIFPIVDISLIIASATIIIHNYPIQLLNLRWIDYFMTILFAITIIWLIRYEILRKMIFIEVLDNHFLRQNVFFYKRIYDFNNLIGYVTQINSSRIGNFEETILSTNDNSKIILSEFFLDNYNEMKIKLTNQIKDNGGARKIEL